MEAQEKTAEGTAEAPFMGVDVLKLYGSEDSIADRLKVDRKTHRKWVWIFVGEIASLYDDLVSCSQLDVNIRRLVLVS